MTTPNLSPITCDQFADTLADFLERDVAEPVRASMEAHALSCADCGSLLADLRKLRIDAANLPELAPSRDLWSGIAERIEAPVIELPATRPGARSRAGDSATRRTTRWVTIGLAAAALVGITATVTHELTKQSLTRGTATVVATPVVAKPEPTTVAVLSTPINVAKPASRRVAESPNSRLVANKPTVEQTYASEIDHLHALLKTRRADLDSSTAAVIDKNLKIIDEAIVQCRKALKQDPNSRFLMESLNDALDSKVQLLRTAVALPVRM